MRWLTVLTAMVLSGAMASAQRQLTVIVPQSPEFDQVLKRDFPGLEDVAGFAGVGSDRSHLLIYDRAYRNAERDLARRQ